jgi:alanyl-tRNA synthetase
MPTELLYLADTYQGEDTATVLATGTDERGAYLQTDRTIFYPQGGGQAADTGTITIDVDRD